MSTSFFVFLFFYIDNTKNVCDNQSQLRRNMKTRIIREGRIVKEYGIVNGSWKLIRVFC